MTEEECYKENKMCCVCAFFSPFMGSAGVCGADSGCACSRMVDCMDTCKNGKFVFKESENITESERVNYGH